jgi:hypothetical protein
MDGLVVKDRRDEARRTDLRPFSVAACGGFSFVEAEKTRRKRRR